MCGCNGRRGMRFQLLMQLGVSRALNMPQVNPGEGGICLKGRWRP